VGDEGVIVGVLDIDCVDEDGFDEVDQQGLEECVRIIVRSCAW
jgi:putative methionine-R-sulfoxide reductase with GAF domain